MLLNPKHPGCMHLDTSSCTPKFYDAPGRPLCNQAWVTSTMSNNSARNSLESGIHRFPLNTYLNSLTVQEQIK